MITKNRYIDLNLNMLRHPYTGDIVSKYDVEAVKTAIRNLLNTRKGEKVFKPDFGSDIYGILFELMTPATKLLAKRKIQEEILKWEPRVIVDTINIVEQEYGNQTLEITVVFSLIDDPSKSDSVIINLERVR